MFEIVSIETPTLGDRSYLVHNGEVALVIDPQRDIDRVLDVAESRRVRITHVFETHMHNDYVTGGLALARVTGAAYHVNGDDPVSFEHVGLHDGDLVEVAPGLSVRALATPGHTYTHLSYVLATGGSPVGVFSGGSLLYGSTGRPDLLGVEHADALARRQHASARRLAEELPESAELFPTHGFGSFCSATQTGGTSSTIGQEKLTNPALRLSEDDFVTELMAGLDAFPAYYAHMGPANQSGPDGADLSPPALADPDELRRRIEAGEWVVDLRSRTAFATGHVAGSLNFGLDGSFATYLGWLIPWGTPVTLLGETASQVAEAQRELVRIGIDRPAAAATGTPQDWAGDAALAGYRQATFSDLRAADPSAVILDVRRRLEWEEGHIAGAVAVPLHQLLDRIDEIPDGEVWVHCRSGYRASLAASILGRAGRQVVAVDDEYSNAADAGLPLTTPADKAP
ncbi:MBL fold metallo-hydrolase [Acidiferrimicrobium sp. IK]|uniref:MBL fold metallo-hydrolase n=1 Tax=Acidiferrimicrobium sp. IK TaxID=2871700 RepID=UPI0021CB4335|nr:MBL fold metallo-hydrolase [Acidiferrimicrobium sp. IK]MCU4185234.1 MBL fold metallo-hydrolase [Acidiferrimicrobium sp. IK]